MDYILKRSKRQSVQVQIDYDGALIVKAPLKYPTYKINAFLDSKRQWIEKNIAEISDNNIYSDHHIHILGQKYSLEHVKSLRNFIVQNENENIIHIEMCGTKNPQDLLAKKFRSDAENYLTNRFNILNNETQKLDLYTSEPVKIKKFKRKWGCCSYRGLITLNYKLYHAPENVIDSVIYHELCHLKFFNHSADFYALLHELDPHYKEHNNILKHYAAYLGSAQ